jgi:hypothetical protein
MIGRGSRKWDADVVAWWTCTLFIAWAWIMAVTDDQFPPPSRLQQASSIHLVEWTRTEETLYAPVHTLLSWHSHHMFLAYMDLDCMHK